MLATACHIIETGDDVGTGVYGFTWSLPSCILSRRLGHRVPEIVEGVLAVNGTGALEVEVIMFIAVVRMMVEG